MRFAKLSKMYYQPTLINLHPNEYSKEFHYYSFAVKLDRCVGSCNTLNDVSNKVYGPNKPKHVQHDYRNKWIGNVSKAYIVQMQM